MTHLIVICLIGLTLLRPFCSLVMYDSRGKELERAALTEGGRVVLSHLNSIYDQRVEEILVLKGDSLELAGVETSSYGIHEYYRTTEGVAQYRWKEINLRNSSGRKFQLWVAGRKMEALEEHPDSLLLLRIERGNPWRRLFGRP